MGQKKKHAAFLSFADPDRDLVKELHELFSNIGFSTYFAPRRLGETGSPEWRQEIIKGIRTSHCFIPVYTRHSIGRPWVLYESGVADAVRLRRYPARVSSVSISDLEYLPAQGALVYDLFDKEGLTNLLVNACLAMKTEAKGVLRARVKEIMREYPDSVKRIINLSKERWVFIAGNSPTDMKKLKSQLLWCTSKSQYSRRLKKFATTVTRTLLEKGFSISACPQVSHVGRPAIDAAVDWLAEPHGNEHVDYRISGIHPLDRDARESNLSSVAKGHWLDHILSFRRSYLEDQEWMLLVGGNRGTLDEYEAAKACGVKIFGVPCFGGTALDVWKTEATDADDPCVKCRQKDGKCEKECIEDIVSFIKKKNV